MYYLFLPLIKNLCDNWTSHYLVFYVGQHYTIIVFYLQSLHEVANPQQKDLSFVLFKEHHEMIISSSKLL